MSIADFTRNINAVWEMLWNINLFGNYNLVLVFLIVFLFSIIMGFVKGK